MGRKETVDAIFSVKKPTGFESGSAHDSDRVRTGPISAMQHSLKEITNGAEEAIRLRKQIDGGHNVIELDTKFIDVSMISDRLPAEIDPSFDTLLKSIEVNGQQVPILVRPHPDQSDHYQIAYGHRRMRAAAILGIKVKAIIRQLTDAELVIAQGKENLERRNLSYIEKALFARRLEDAGFDRSVIISALATDKADLSRYIAVGRMIPESLLHVIGPAEKAGRSRWLALADLLKNPASENLVPSLIERAEFKCADSDSRFSFLFNKLLEGAPVYTHNRNIWINRDGQKAARIEFRKDRLTLIIDENLVPSFGNYLVSQLDELYEKFTKEKGETAKPIKED